VLNKQNKKQKLNNGTQLVGNEGVPLNDPKVPFLKLLQGNEPVENVKLRYRLYEQSIKRQDKISKKILDDISDQTLNNINEIIKSPINKQTIDTILLLSTASFSSGSNFISQLTEHLSNDHQKVIRLSSKECNTIKIALKKIVGSILEELSSGGLENIDDDNEEDEEDEEDNEEDNDDYDSDDEDDYTGTEVKHKRLPFDIDTIDDWCSQYFYRKNQVIEKTDLRIVLLFEDTDSFNMGLLNQLLKLTHHFIDRIPFKIICNVGTNVENFAKKLDHDLHVALNFHQFKIEQTESILNKIVSEILIEDDYLVGNESIQFLLSRFDNSIRDVNEFLRSLKFLKMCFFFNQPLSVINFMYQKDKKLSLGTDYFQAIKMLPSFRRHVEQIIREKNSDKEQILELINGETEIKLLLIQATNDYIRNLKTFRSIFKFITSILLKYCSIASERYLEYFAKLTNKDYLVKNQFINEILTSLKKIEMGSLIKLLAEFDIVASDDDLLQSLKSKIRASINIEELIKFYNDPEFSRIQFKIEYRNLLNSFILLVENLLKNSWKIPSDLLFYEIFQFNGIDILKSSLIPRTRTIIEDSLTDPELYINIKQNSNLPLDKLNAKLNPIIAELFQIYRETSLNLNIYDFYQVFKNSLRQNEIMNDIMEILDSSDNVFENYLNDEKRFKFIYQFFNDVDIPEDLKFDKLMLVLFLQKCGELIDCGFLKQIKRKGDSLEKCVWKEL